MQTPAPEIASRWYYDECTMRVTMVFKLSNLSSALPATSAGVKRRTHSMALVVDARRMSQDIRQHSHASRSLVLVPWGVIFLFKLRLRCCWRCRRSRRALIRGEGPEEDGPARPTSASRRTPADDPLFVTALIHGTRLPCT